MHTPRGGLCEPSDIQDQKIITDTWKPLLPSKSEKMIGGVHLCRPLELV